MEFLSLSSLTQRKVLFCDHRACTISLDASRGPLPPTCIITDKIRWRGCFDLVLHTLGIGYVSLFSTASQSAAVLKLYKTLASVLYCCPSTILQFWIVHVFAMRIEERWSVTYRGSARPNPDSISGCRLLHLHFSIERTTLLHLI